VIYICYNSNYTAFCKAVEIGPVLSEKHSITVTWYYPERGTQLDGEIWSSPEGGIQPNGQNCSCPEGGIEADCEIWSCPEGGTQTDG
jgi:hypothetical protein